MYIPQVDIFPLSLRYFTLLMSSVNTTIPSVWTSPTNELCQSVMLWEDGMQILLFLDRSKNAWCSVWELGLSSATVVTYIQRKRASTADNIWTIKKTKISYTVTHCIQRTGTSLYLLQQQCTLCKADTIKKLKLYSIPKLWNGRLVRVSTVLKYF